jgi:hypothetical protein
LINLYFNGVPPILMQAMPQNQREGNNSVFCEQMASLEKLEKSKQVQSMTAASAKASGQADLFGVFCSLFIIKT